MSNSERHERTRTLLRRADEALAVCRACIEEVAKLSTGGTSPAPYDGPIGNVLGSEGTEPWTLFARPFVDAASMTVTWDRRTCRIRSAILLGLLARLARRPNEYVPFDRLLRDVWGVGKRSDDTIRSSVRHLKKKLAAEGMPDLAARIRAAGRRYGLVFEPG